MLYGDVPRINWVHGYTSSQFPLTANATRAAWRRRTDQAHRVRDRPAQPDRGRMERLVGARTH